MPDLSVLQVSVLGAPKFARDGSPITGFASTKVQALLCYLALTARPHLRDTLVGLLWSEMPNVDAKTNLRQALANLRRLVGDYLLIERDTVTFNSASPHWIDAEEFERLAKSQWQMANANQREQAVRDLQLAISYFRGDLLEGFFVRDAPEFEEWLVTQRERLRQQALQLFHTLVAYHLANHEYARGIDYATRLLALDPWREEAHQQLMMLYARNRQRGAALAQYDTCRRVLAEKIGVEPSAETTALYERIQAANTMPRLNLPPPVTPFIGRVDELLEIAQHLADPGCRLLTLVGPGGTGKTRLALQVASNVAASFLHGACFVPLAAVNSTDFVVSAIANALQLTPGKGDLKTQLLDYLRNKEMLLVLDNFEHLISGAAFLSKILEFAPTVNILATSRERLNVYGETVFSIHGLLYPDDKQTHDVSRCDAVQLFLVSAHRANSRLASSDKDLPSVIRICHLLDGLPLGIELAATWVTTQSCLEIVREIERNLDFLATTQHEVPERQRSLRATFDHSWKLLTNDEQRVFRALSVFREGFTQQAADAVIGEQSSANSKQSTLNSVRVLMRLVNKSLLRRAESGRYEMHEAVRQYAQEKLAQAPDEAEQIIRRHSEYFAEFLYQRTENAKGAQKNLVLDEIDAEMGNIRAAWQWAVENREWYKLGRALECLYLFYDIRSRFQEGKAAFGAAATALTDTTETTDQAQLILAQLLARQAIFHYRDDDFAPAKAFAESSLAIAQRLESSKDIALIFNCLGNIAFSVGDYTEARRWHLERLAIEKNGNDPWRISVTLNNLGITANAQGDLVEARKLFEECITLKRKIGDRRGLAMSLDNFGIVLSNQGDYAASLQCRQEALPILREIGDKDGVGRVLNNIGRVLYIQGKYAEAQSRLQESLATSQEIGNREMMMYAQGNLGAVACELGDYAQAEKYHLAALKIALEIHTVPNVLSALGGIARLDAKQGRRERAVELLAFMLAHPATTLEAKQDAEPLLAELTAQLPPDVATAARERGQARKYENVVAKILDRGTTNW